MSNSADLLKEKKVIVIGGSSGIGRSVAAAALAHGASVVIASSSQEKVGVALDRLKQAASPSLSAITGQALDIKDFAALNAFLTREGPFDHLVITAGDIPGNLNFPEQDLDIQSLRSLFDVRYWAVIAAAQHIYKNKLIIPGGSITLTIGTAFYRPIPGFGLASGIAGSVESSTRGLAIDLKPIRVNTICPGLVDTELFNSMPEGMKEELFNTRGKGIPVGHIGNPDEVAEAYIFAMKCTYLTGQVIVVDGGAIIA